MRKYAQYPTVCQYVSGRYAVCKTSFGIQIYIFWHYNTVIVCSSDPEMKHMSYCKSTTVNFNTSIIC